jgi:putative ABC transport system substrate-binding protein
MTPAKEAELSKSDRSWSCTRIFQNWLHGARYSVIAALLLIAPVSVPAAEEKPIEIGVLALGPRTVPAWHCGSEDYQVASSTPRLETKPPSVLGLRDEMERLNYVEDRPENSGKRGRRFALDVRMGTLQEVRDYAREFVRKRVELIVAVATATVRIAQEETHDSPIPIVMTAVSDPVSEGFVRTLARPGGFITGVGHQMVQGSGKRVELFKELMPELRRLITIRRPGYRPSEESLQDIRDVTRDLKIELLDLGVNNREELRTALAKTPWRFGDGIMVVSDTFIISNIDLVLETSLKRHVPAFGTQDYMANWGALAAYGPSAYESGAHDAVYVDKIIKGAKPGDLAIEPIDPIFVVNLKSAQCLGVHPPLGVLHQADRVIREGTERDLD